MSHASSCRQRAWLDHLTVDAGCSVAKSCTTQGKERRNKEEDMEESIAVTSP